MRTTLALAAFLGLAAGTLLAQTDADTLSARLVTAGREAGSTDERLKDVLGLLQNLNFRSFRLDGEARIPFSEGASAGLAKGYRIELSEVQARDRSALVRVIQDRHDKVKTRLSLRKEKPVVVGGFEDPGGGSIFIILMLTDDEAGSPQAPPRGRR